jgi:hypothetical protein
MANDEEMFVLFEDFERQRRQFYHAQSPFTSIQAGPTLTIFAITRLIIVQKF